MCFLKLLNLLTFAVLSDLSLLWFYALRAQRTLRDLRDLRQETWECNWVRWIRLNTKRKIYCAWKIWICGYFCWSVRGENLTGSEFSLFKPQYECPKNTIMLEDLYSGEERRSDKYMYMTPNEMWKEKIIKGQVTFPIYSKRVVLGGESYCILGENNKKSHSWTRCV